MDYKLIDSGHGKKWERFGKVTLVRPSAQAVWSPKLSKKEWEGATARFSRQKGSRWHTNRSLPDSWIVSISGIRFKLKATDFGHLGVFPEQAPLWEWISKQVDRHCRVLNLFAYSGGATLAAAKAGASVCHVDASSGMIGWAKENAALNGLDKAPIRWFVEDARKYVARAARRGDRFDGIILDPPTFGRGKSGEVFKIESDLAQLLDLCFSLLSDSPRFVLFTAHTPGYTPIVMRQLLEERLKGEVESGEMVLKGPFDLPSGSFARWKS